jgi:DNA-binding PadR family transcriptional regulator
MSKKHNIEKILNDEIVDLLSNKLKVLLLFRKEGALSSVQLTEKYKETYLKELKVGSLHGTLSRLKVESLITTKIEIEVDSDSNERPVKLYRESEKGYLAINKAIFNLQNTVNLQPVPT